MKKSCSWGILFATGMLFLLLIHLGARSFRLLTGETESAFTNPTTGLEVGLAACIFLLFRQNAARRWKLLEALPVVPLCYPIYYLHVITMELIFGLGWTPHSFLGTLGFTLLNFLLCYLLCKTAVSIRPICYLCSGMPFPEACRSCNWQYTIKRIREKESA